MPGSRFTVINYPNNSQPKTKKVSKLNKKNSNNNIPLKSQKSRFVVTNAPNNVQPKSRFTVVEVPENKPKSRFTVTNAPNNVQPNSRFTVLEVPKKKPKTEKIGRFTIREIPSMSNENKTKLKKREFESNILSGRTKKLKNPFETISLVENHVIKFKNNIAFKLIEKVGEGGQGEVWKAQISDKHSLNDKLYKDLYRRNKGKFFAIKFLRLKYQNEIINFNKEIKNLIKLTKEAEKNPEVEGSNNFAKLYLKGQLGNYHIIVSEFITGIELTQNFIKLLTGHIVLSKNRGLHFFIKLFEQLLKTLNFIHSNNIVHRDIKPNNILVTEGEYYFVEDTRYPISVPIIKIVDFGISCGQYETNECLSGTTNSIVGTEGFIDPALYEVTDESTTLDDAKKGDVYSLGVVFFYLLNHFHIFDTDDFFETPDGLRYRFIREFLPIKSYRHATFKEEYKLLDFITNCMFENKIKFRLDLDTLLSIFDGSYKYIQYVPGIKHLADLNNFSIEASDYDCDCEENIFKDKDCQFNKTFYEKNLACQHVCSQIPKWKSKCNNFIPSITHCLAYAIENNPGIEIENWLKLVNNQHKASLKEVSDGYPKQYRRH